MEINILEQKEIFNTCCNENIHRDGLDKLLGWLEKSDFYRAPASSRYHGSYDGGLAQHSLDVFEYAKKFAPLLPVEISNESMAVSALFHDVCKVNFYKVDYKNAKIDGEWQKVPYYAVEEKFPFGGHGSKSVFLVERFMKLEPEEAVAINCHMGFSDAGSNSLNIGKAYERYPLAWLIHVADEAATYLMGR